jgi:prepilin-type processing-associated H-X9-DG protein
MVIIAIAHTKKGGGFFSRLIIAILAAILFPVFAKAREKARQTACLNNQKQIATLITIYSQDHDELLPPSAGVWGAINIDKAVLICPTAGNKVTNGYGFNAHIGGFAIGELGSPSDVIFTADSSAADNLIVTPSDVDIRHMQQPIMSYADGHVARSSDILGIFTATKDMFAGIPTLTSPEAGTGGTRRDADWVIDGNGWTTTLDSDAANVGYLMKDGNGSGAGKHWTGMYYTTTTPSAMTSTGMTGKKFWIRTWESKFGTACSASRRLTMNADNTTLRSNVAMWVLEMDYTAVANDINSGNGENGPEVRDASGNVIAKFKFRSAQDQYSPIILFMNSYKFIPDTWQPTPYVLADRTALNTKLFSYLNKTNHMKIVGAGGKIYFSYGSLSCVTSATGQWQNPGTLYQSMVGYSTACWVGYQNLKYTDIQTRDEIINRVIQ